MTSEKGKGGGWLSRQVKSAVDWQQKQEAANRQFYQSPEGKEKRREQRAKLARQAKFAAKIGGGMLGTVGRMAIQKGIEQAPGVISAAKKLPDRNLADAINYAQSASKTLADIGKKTGATAARKAPGVAQQVKGAAQKGIEKGIEVTPRQAMEIGGKKARKLAEGGGRKFRLWTRRLKK
jgi:hypothetical protein